MPGLVFPETHNFASRYPVASRVPIGPSQEKTSTSEERWRHYPFRTAVTKVSTMVHPTT